MNLKSDLKTAKLPKVLGELTHSIQFLKMFSVSTLGLLLLALVTIFVLASRKPLVLTLTANGSSLRETGPPKPEDEIQKAIEHYLELRYRWGPVDVGQKLSAAKSFILPSKVTAYQNAVANVARFSVEKQVSQKVYPEKFIVNLEKRIVSILGDRMTSIQGLKAAGDLRLELTFENGPRTKENPWGIYISKEREE